MNETLPVGDTGATQDPDDTLERFLRLLAYPTASADSTYKK